jgi:hypothetical protein
LGKKLVTNTNREGRMMSGIGRHGGVWDAVKSPGIVKTGSCDRSRCEQEREVLVS